MKKRNTKIDREIERLKLMRDEDINTSDVPEITDWSRAVVGKFYRPVKEPVTLRLDADIIAWFKSKGPGYQTRINNLLRKAMATGAVSASAAIEARYEAADEPPTLERFHFPNLERHGQLEKCNHIAGLIAERGSLFAPTP
jgi:uncharacterized protein (DUF4415 family)